MVPPKRCSEIYHQIYHHLMVPAGKSLRMLMDDYSIKTRRKLGFSWTSVDFDGRVTGDPYGIRTRISAVKGPRPNP